MNALPFASASFPLEAGTPGSGLRASRGGCGVAPGSEAAFIRARREGVAVAEASAVGRAKLAGAIARIRPRLWDASHAAETRWQRGRYVKRRVGLGAVMLLVLELAQIYCRIVMTQLSYH